MNFGDIFRGLLLHFLHFFGGDNGGKDVATFEPYNTTYSTIIYDPSTFTKISGNDSSKSPIISTIFSSNFTTEENVQKNQTGITSISEVTDPSKTTTSGSAEPSNTTTSDITEPSNTTDITEPSNTTDITEPSNTTDITEPSNTTTSDITEPSNTTTSDITEPSNTTTSNITEPSNTTISESPEPSNTTAVSHSTGSVITESSTTSSTTDVTPTPKPKGLSRGAVAGIVIGCLLLIAVIAAGVVFFVKNRNTGPEHERLRV